MNLYNFEHCLAWSDGYADRGDIVGAIVRGIPGCLSVVRASRQEDRHGTDYWAKRTPPQRDLSVDVKRRSRDPTTDLYPPSDDLALETFSEIPSARGPGKIGWTRDPAKTTDFILWFWRTTGRTLLVPFPPLCLAFREKWQEWRALYPVKTQRSESDGREWHSECVCVPRVVVQDEINKSLGGCPEDPAQLVLI